MRGAQLAGRRLPHGAGHRDATNRLGAALPRRVAAGEVVSIGTADISQIGGAIDITARGAGAVVAHRHGGGDPAHRSVPLGLVVVLGVPVLMAVVGLLIRPLHHRQQAYRDAAGRADRAGRPTSSPGCGCCAASAARRCSPARYRRRVAGAARAPGVRVARVESLLEAAQVLLPGVFVVLVTWLGARFALAGRDHRRASSSPSTATPRSWSSRCATLTEAVDKLTRGHVAARRVVRLLRLAPELRRPGAARRRLPSRAGRAGRRRVRAWSCRPGRLTALGRRPRRGRDRDRRPARPVRRRGRDAGRRTAAGGGAGDGAGADPGGRQRRAAVRRPAARRSWTRTTRPTPRRAARRRWHAASATDIVEALPDGLDTAVAERGREFSGGQQQRLRLARALVADPEMLVLVEPTSAVDAHTEARIAERLGAARAGPHHRGLHHQPAGAGPRRPRGLRRADGKVVAEGPHRGAAAHRARGTRATVSRGRS